MDKAFLPGFSKNNKEAKRALISALLAEPESFLSEISSFDHPDPEIQARLDKFAENTIANFPLPFGIAPNFLINGTTYHLPMAVEESSVVAAAASAAKFWYDRGGFTARIKGVEKIGQIHFFWKARPELLKEGLPLLTKHLLDHLKPLTKNMDSRGGGITGIELIDLSNEMPELFQFRVSFRTADSMGANFINSCLEAMAKEFKEYSLNSMCKDEPQPEVLMSILSNYTPSCLVEVKVECTLDNLNNVSDGMSGEDFANRFMKAVHIAKSDVYRAVTPNKGIFNGIDAVVIATGNDYRAVEAAGHAYASKTGRYRSLSDCRIENEIFSLSLEIPLALGTVGGLTSLHPLSRWSFEILGKPNAEELMMMVASAGLANNFSAVRALVTSGIQKGHMKMHLGNILEFLKAKPDEKNLAENHFKDKEVSYHAVSLFLQSLKNKE
jgi:hydroxymethylglutaryl-CoA reductase